MGNDNVKVKKRIKTEFLRSSNKYRAITIPSGISFYEEGNSVEMKLSSKGVCANMQHNDNAFEGWALVLKRWGKYETVIIHWDKPDNIENGHYQRFLFRLKHFSQDFNSWFSIHPECQILLEGLKIKHNGSYVLNIPGKRGTEVKDKPEAILEDRFVNGDLREFLIKISNAKEIYRQLPVRVFNESISGNKPYLDVDAIFAGGFIDMWGVSDNNELLVFELKAPDKIMVGIISELYFYTCVLQTVREKIFNHENCYGENEPLLKIPTTNRIKAYFLATTLHPLLLDGEILRLFNDGAHEEISYQFIQIDTEYKLTINTFNA